MTARIIKNSHITVKPFKFDIDYNIVPFLSSAPFAHGVARAPDLSVTIFKGLQPFSNIELDQDRIYQAKISGAQCWFSQMSKKTNIVIKLDCPGLVERNLEFSKINTDVSSVYVPHLTLAYDIPSPDKDTRWWVNDILTKFNEGSEGKYFGTGIRLAYESISDTVITDDDSKIPIITKPF